jgi:hypothetical protein
VCILKANFIDVKISAWLPVFLTTLNLVSFSRKIFTVIFVCIYLRAFKKKKKKRKKEKEKYDCLIFLRLKNKQKDIFKTSVHLRRQ